MSAFPRSIATLAVLAAFAATSAFAANQEFTDGEMYVWAARNYSSWDNPLHTELVINGETVDIFSSDKFVSIQSNLKPGWNDITLITTPQEPAVKENGLIFRFGPMYRDPNNAAQFNMQPVLWQVRNDTDWRLENGAYSHPLGPGVKEVRLNYHVYWAGLDHESSALKAGDYVVQAKPEYASWNTPVVATIYLNGTPLNTFCVPDRQLVITDLLKPGKNEIRVISQRVDNAIADNDVKVSVSGPAEWYADRGQFMVAPITEFEASQGWKRDAKSGQLVNVADATASTIERTVAFMKKE